MHATAGLHSLLHSSGPKGSITTKKLAALSAPAVLDCRRATYSPGGSAPSVASKVTTPAVALWDRSVSLTYGRPSV